MSTKFTKALKQDDLFTGGKLPEFAVFYNIAFFNMAGLLYHLINPKEGYENDKDKLERAFKKWLEGIQQNQDILRDAGYGRLRRYLWKGYLTEKNRSGYMLTEDDKACIRKMLIKLYHIRNFHSHYWHDNAELEFDAGLKEFIEKLHTDASNSMAEKYAFELPVYNQNYHKHPFFKTHDGKTFMTQEGRTFFLGFFLTRGQMTRFMQQHKGCKRNDQPEFKIKYEVYRYYTHRDGAARHYYGYEDEVFSQLPEDERQQVWKARQGFKLINYLNDIPAQSNDPELFPLFLHDGRQMSDVAEKSWHVKLLLMVYSPSGMSN